MVSMHLVGWTTHNALFLKDINLLEFPNFCIALGQLVSILLEHHTNYEEVSTMKLFVGSILD
jgi:hypothetical protein